MDVDGLQSVGLHPLTERGDSLLPEGVEALDLLAVLVKAVVEPEEDVGAVGVGHVANGLLLAQGGFYLAHQRRFAGAELGDFKLDAAVFEIDAVPAEAEEFPHAAADVVAREEGAFGRRVQLIAEERVVAILQTDVARVLGFRAPVEVAKHKRRAACGESCRVSWRS